MPCTSCQALHLEIRELREQYNILMNMYEEAVGQYNDKCEAYDQLDDEKSVLIYINNQKLQVQYEQHSRNAECLESAYKRTQNELAKYKSDVLMIIFRNINGFKIKQN